MASAGRKTVFFIKRNGVFIEFPYVEHQKYAILFGGVFLCSVDQHSAYTAASHLGIDAEIVDIQSKSVAFFYNIAKNVSDNPAVLLCDKNSVFVCKASGKPNPYRLDLNF